MMRHREEDVIPLLSAVSTLVDAHVVSDDDMTDYYVCQAYRSVATVAAADDVTAGNGAPLPFDLLMDDMCRRVVTSRKALDTCAYLHCRLVYEQGSSYGEGNRVPCCTQTYPTLLAGYAERTFASHRFHRHSSQRAATATRPQLSPGAFRTLLLGFAVLVRGVVERLVLEAARTPGDFIASSAPEFTRALLHDVVPILAVHAEGLHDDLPASSKLSASASLAGHDSRLPPSMVTVQCNVAVLVIACRLLQDVCAADAYRPPAKPKSESTGAGQPQKAERRVVILDTSIAPLLWDAVSAIRNAAGRHVTWLQDSATLLRQQVKHHVAPAVDDSKGSAADMRALAVCLRVADRWQACDILRLFSDEFLAQQRKEYELLDFHACEVQRSMGERARDAQALRDARWGCTVRTALVASAFAQGVVQSVCNANDCTGRMTRESDQRQQQQAIQGSRTRLVGLVATYVQRALQQQHSVAQHHDPRERPRSDGKNEDTERDSPAARFHSLVALMAAASVVFFECPMDLQQAQLWAADRAVTQAVLQALMAHPIKSRDLVVVRLASLLSASILRSVCEGTAAVADVGSDDIVALLKNENGGVGGGSVDGASQAAVQLAILAVMAKPHVVLPRLFALLDEGTGDCTSTTARSNALSVIVALPRVLADELKLLADGDDGDGGVGEAVSRSAQRVLRVRQAKRARLEEALRGLAHHVLRRLGEDDVLTHRMQSASVFGLFAFEDVVPPLVRMLLKPDRSGRRGAAATALDMTLQRHQLRGVVGFVTCCAELLDERLGEAPSPSVESPNSATLHEKPGPPRVAPATPGEIFLLSELQGLSEWDVLSGDGKMDKGSTDEGNAHEGTHTSGSEYPTRVTKRLRERLLQISASVLTSFARREVAEHPPHTLGMFSANLLLALVRDVAFRQCALRKAATPGKLDATDAREFCQQLVVRSATTFLSEVSKRMQQDESPGKHCGGGGEESTAAAQFTKQVLAACKTIWARADCEAVDRLPNGDGTDGGTHRDLQSSSTFVTVLVLLCLKSLPLHVCSVDAAAPGPQGDCDVHAWFFDTITRDLLGTAVVAPASDISPLARDEALQHLALTVLARYPTRFSLPRLERSFRETARDDALLLRPASALWTLSAEKKRHFRVLVFLLSHSIVDHGTWWQRTPPRINLGSAACDHTGGESAQVVTSLATRLQATAWDALLVQPTLDSRGSRHVTTDEQKITAAALDLLALVLIAALVSPAFAATVDSLAKKCLQDTASVESGDAGESIRTSIHVALCVLRSSVKILAQQSLKHLGREHFGFWHAEWARMYLPFVVRLSNASAARGLRDNSENPANSRDFQLATQCVEVVFAFVLSYRGPAASGELSDDRENAALTDPGRYLSPDDRAALVEYALGCLQFSACPSLQLEAIKLSSALMATLPSMFAGEEGQARFHRMTLRLQSLSLMHPIAEARRLAENVVGTISSAVQSSQSL